MTSVEISGCTFPVAGMLSRWKQCDLLRKCYRDVKHEDIPDLPIVIEKYMPRHHAAVLGMKCVMMGPQALANGDVDFVTFYPFDTLPTNLGAAK